MRVPRFRNNILKSHRQRFINRRSIISIADKIGVVLWIRKMIELQNINFVCTIEWVGTFQCLSCNYFVGVTYNNLPRICSGASPTKALQTRRHPPLSHTASQQSFPGPCREETLFALSNCIVHLVCHIDLQWALCKSRSQKPALPKRNESITNCNSVKLRREQRMFHVPLYFLLHQNLHFRA